MKNREAKNKARKKVRKQGRPLAGKNKKKL